MGVIKREEQRLGGRSPQAGQDGVKVICRSWSRTALRRVGRHCRSAQQGFEGLADQAERQGGLSDVGPADPHLEPVPGGSHRVFQHCRLPKPGFADDEQRPASALKRLPHQAAHRRQDGIPLDHDCGHLLPPSAAGFRWP